MATQAQVEEELRAITRNIQQEASRSNGKQGPAREGVAEDLARVLEQHADDLLREAQEHAEAAREFANDIRRRADEKAAELRAFVDSIKASKSGLEEVRTNFLQAQQPDVLKQASSERTTS